MNSQSIFLCFFCIALVTGCGKVYIISHDEDKAALQAEKFAQTAYVDQKLKQAYSMLSGTLRESLTAEAFEDAIKQMHPGKFPSDIQATEFEPIPGQRAMIIYLVGTSDSEEFHYRMFMTGTSGDGYKVEGFYRAREAYPPSQLRKKLSPPLK